MYVSRFGAQQIPVARVAFRKCSVDHILQAKPVGFCRHVLEQQLCDAIYNTVTLEVCRAVACFI